jgi:hypothetical protein
MKQSLIDEITKVLKRVPIVENLARKKFVSQYIVALVKSRNVQFCEVAQHLNNNVKLASNEIRIQDFFREVEIDYHCVAALLLSLLPKGKKLRLCIDRTEWDFGKCQVNILMILVGYGELQIPLYWELLDNKSGNSNANDRINLLSYCIEIIGKNRLGLVVGDREFIGHYWIKYLKDNGLKFIMRMPKSHLITTRDGLQRTVSSFDLSLSKPVLLRDCQVNGIWGNVWLSLLENGEYLFLFGTATLEFMGQLYRKRWSIESCFQNLKGRGFNLEATHLKSLTKLKKLVALVSIAYSFCVGLGLYFHRKVQNIKTKKHGRKSVSLSRHGLNLIREISRDQTTARSDLIFKIMCLFRWVRKQLSHYQNLKIVG